MKTIMVNVFRDTTGYHGNGNRKAVPAEIEVVRFETLRESDYGQVSDYSNRLLKVFHAATGPLWIDDTKETLQAKSNAAFAGSPSPSSAPIYFRIGDGGALTPAATSTSYTNTAMAGATSANYLVHLNGKGYLNPATEFTFKPAGGIDLIGMQFDDQSFWTIEKI